MADFKTLARNISIVENEREGYETLLSGLTINQQIPIIGITGPPGAGKSTLLNALIAEILHNNSQLKIGVIVIDPSSPFSKGALLGDRVRMGEHFIHLNVFIRSLATRGALGGLSAKTIEVIDLMRSEGFHYIFVETVGVGQSEVEIAALADLTLLVLVPESGDDIQTIKSGVMEIANIFVVNKADREDASLTVKNLLDLIEHSNKKITPPILKTVATSRLGISELLKEIHHSIKILKDKKSKTLLVAKAFQLIIDQQSRKINKIQLENDLAYAMQVQNFNIYSFVREWIKKNLG